MNPEMMQYLQPTQAVDNDHPAIVEFALNNSGNSPDPKDRSVSLYYAVRDGIRYDP
jgi:transglutaminase-like putative cysteine protease